MLTIVKLSYVLMLTVTKISVIYTQMHTKYTFLLRLSDTQRDVFTVNPVFLIVLFYKGMKCRITAPPMYIFSRCQSQV